MGSKPVSPQRPRGPGAPASASVIVDHGHAQQPPHAPGSSRSSLFGLFRRRPSQSSAAPRAASTTSGHDSFLGAFDSFSIGAGAAGLEAPQQTKASGGKVARMLDAAARYRESIRGMGAAAAEFGAALYECADTKGAAAGRTALPEHHVDSDFQAAAGLHLLVSNHASVLAASMESKFDEPVRREYEEHARRVATKEAEFRSGLRAKLQALREAEQQNIRDSRRRTRDLLSYRSTLLDLTSQIDDINRFKFDFLSDLHTMSTELAEAVHRALASAVTAEIEVFDSIARKGWSGGGLDGLLAGCPDPFEPENRAGSGSAPASERSPRWAAPDPPLRPDSAASSDGASVSSSNLFSVLPQSSILPAAVDSDDSATLSRRNSSISDIADLTLTPRRPSAPLNGDSAPATPRAGPTADAQPQHERFSQSPEPGPPARYVSAFDSDEHGAPDELEPPDAHEAPDAHGALDAHDRHDRHDEATSLHDGGSADEDERKLEQSASTHHGPASGVRAEPNVESHMKSTPRSANGSANEAERREETKPEPQTHSPSEPNTELAASEGERAPLPADAQPAQAQAQADTAAS